MKTEAETDTLGLLFISFFATPFILAVWWTIFIFAIEHPYYSIVLFILLPLFIIYKIEN